MSDARRIIPKALRGVYNNWHFAPAVEAEGLIFCSGIIGTSTDGNKPQASGSVGGSASGLEGAEAVTADGENGLAALVAVRDPVAQFETAFEALEAILIEAGAGLADVVEITSYHVDMARHMEAFMAVKDRYLLEPYPAWSAIGVAELIVPGGLVELRAVAKVPSA
ncbi:RidA family protein [Rhodobacteraceae bacterium D3-12]|nr:RidA family protein [Rhodobacteraceae bacterium D3-12]